jgi:colanic acid biosynthesis glycosyl transferase WcaI
VPSKVLSYLCAGRPLLASMPEENLAARTIQRAEAGIVTVSGDAAAFSASAELLLSNPNLRIELGHAARSYAERTFRIDAIADRFENALTDAVVVRTKA